VGRIERLYERGNKHFQRGLETNSRASLDTAIDIFISVDGALPDWDPRRTVLDVQLAIALTARHKLADSVADLSAAITRLRRVIASPDLVEDVDPAACRLLLGEALTDRIERYASPDYPFALPSDEEFLDELTLAVDSLTIAVDSDSATLSPSDRAEAARLRGYLLPKLATGKAMAARKAGQAADVEELERTLRDLPNDHPVRPRLILELGFAYMSRVVHDATMLLAPGSSAHREPAGRYLTQALSLLTPDDPERGVVLAALAQLGHSAAVLGLDRPPDDQLARLTAEFVADADADPQLRSFLQLIGMLSEPGAPAPDTAAALERLAGAQGLAQDNELLGQMAEIVLSQLISHPSAPTASLDDREAQDLLHKQLFTLFETEARTAAAAEPGSPGLLAQFSHPSVWQAITASDQVWAALLDGDVASLDTAIGELRAQLDAIPADHALRWMVTGLLGGAWQARGFVTGDVGDLMRGLRLGLDSARDGLTSPLVNAPYPQRMLRQRIAQDEVELASLTGDVPALSAALRALSALHEDPSMTKDDRIAWAQRYGMGLIRRHELTGDLVDLDRGIVRLEQAARLSGDMDPGGGGYAPAQNLSVAYWTRADRSRRDQERALDTGMLALRQRAAIVLLQGGPAHGLQSARWHGFVQVVQLVSWCVAEDRIDLAVQALELGRALVLHTTTITADIPALLAAAGQESLASQWRADAGRAAPAPGTSPFTVSGLSATGDGGLPLQVPSALRRKVLSALSATSVGGQLLTAPSLPGLTGALSDADVDAFVYLIPPLSGAGSALLVSADGELDWIPLPGLAEAAPLDSYESACQQTADREWTDLTDWHHTLEALCDWAWTAVAQPVLSHAARWQRDRPPRLVIIPVGRLSLVPWHAARTTGADGQPHYAIQDAVFCYAASAGQFIRAAARPARPPTEAPVLVSNPTGDLKLAESEVAELLRRYYPGAAYLGRPAELATGTATPPDVLSRLPGGSMPLASLLHCGCHAVATSPLTQSHLLLDAHQPLMLSDILGQAQRHDPASPGFMAVLSACMTDLATTDHDEALTLASALLASGASGVVGARWPVHDKATAPLMVMFHHFLNNGYSHPADALRAAQLWMLTPSRPILDDLPEALASAARASGFLMRPYCWAAFTYQGAYLG
jgi:CHAT domain